MICCSPIAWGSSQMFRTEYWCCVISILGTTLNCGTSFSVLLYTFFLVSDFASQYQPVIWLSQLNLRIFPSALLVCFWFILFILFRNVGSFNSHSLRWSNVNSADYPKVSNKLSRNSQNLCLEAISKFLIVWMMKGAQTL